ncbi:MAG TPA: GyrI-like domain-containing protein [Methanotrichaceae archaeon]|nr:GyrI-like domain-containing protein [Methanotrichaceae archaeon]
MDKIDLKKELKGLYSASSKKAEILEVPAMNFLMVDGSGDPNTSEAYQKAIKALYAVSYGLKFCQKKQGRDYSVMPLEGLWWSEDMSSFICSDRSLWKWTAMIMQPDFITPDMARQATEDARAKKGLSVVPRFEAYQEGLSAQIMHIGPYSTEGPTVKMLHGFIEESGYERNGKHHELYLSDPRRAKPEKMKTILRQPIRRPG